MNKVRSDIEKLWNGDFEAYKEVKLPVARIKKIMKTDEDVRMISIEAPILFSKACELFIMDLAYKVSFYARWNQKTVIDKMDLALAVSESESHDFLIDLIPEVEMESLMKVRRLSAY